MSVKNTTITFRIVDFIVHLWLRPRSVVERLLGLVKDATKLVNCARSPLPQLYCIVTNVLNHGGIARTFAQNVFVTKGKVVVDVGVTAAAV